MITLPKTSKACLNLLIATSLVFGLSAMPAHATQNNGTSADVTVKSLKDKGYKCETVSVGFVECTKTGKTTQWCSGGKCVDKPLRGNSYTRSTAPNNAGVVLDPSAYTPISDMNPAVFAVSMVMQAN